MAWRAHTWEMAVERYRGLAAHVPYTTPLYRVTWEIATSRYAGGLRPVTSMWTLRIYQNETYDWLDDRILIDLDEDTGKIIVRYASGPHGQPHTVVPLESRWERRDHDGFAASEQCLQHLRWFVEYSPAART
jgi:hypothetical protein